MFVVHLKKKKNAFHEEFSVSEKTVLASIISAAVDTILVRIGYYVSWQNACQPP